MIEVSLMKGSWRIYTETCNKGELVPTIVGLMQKYEREHGDLENRQQYAITFCAFEK